MSFKSGQNRFANLRSKVASRKNSNYNKNVDSKVIPESESTLQIQKRIRATVPPGRITDICVGIFKNEHKARTPARVTSEIDSVLNRPQLGPPDSSTMCVVCGLTSDCVGHNGVIKIAGDSRFTEEDNDGAIINPIYYPYVVKTLISVCHNCSEPYIAEDKMESLGLTKIKDTASRLTEIGNKIANTKHPFVCRNVAIKKCTPNEPLQMKDASEKGLVATGNPGSDTRMSMNDIYMILDRITDENAKLLGFGGKVHPRDLVMKYMNVTAVKHRAISMTDGGEVHQDPMTIAYKNIISSKSSEELYRNVNAMFYKSSDEGLTAKSKKESIADQLKTKDGEFRKAQMARQNNCARSVVGGIPQCPVNSVIVPQYFCEKMTIPETVTSFNQARLKKLLENGRVLFIFDKKGNFRRARPDLEIEIGMILHRKLQDGDYVVYTRQPILSKTSLICLKVIVAKDPRQLSIIINLGICTASNTDFDGDEINLRAMQQVEAIVEAIEILTPEKNVTNPANGRVIMKGIQNTPTGLYLMTKAGTQVTRLAYEAIIDSVYDLLPEGRLKTHEESLKCYGISKYSGRAIFSTILPEDFNFKKTGITDRKGNPKEDVIIESGVLLSGRIDNSALNAHGSIASTINKFYGGEYYIQFLHKAQLLATKWINEVGFTVGPRDLPVPDQEFKNYMEDVYQDLKSEMKSLGWTKKGRIETNRQNKLKQITSHAGNLILEKALVHMKDTNLMEISSEGSGTKGSAVNITQLSSAIGQIYVDGGLLPIESGDGTRTLPWFQPYETDPVSRGYCKASYTEGIPPESFVANQRESRKRVMAMTGETPANGERNKHGVSVTQYIVTSNSGEKVFINGGVVMPEFKCEYDPAHLIPSKGKLLPFNIPSFVLQTNGERGWRPKSNFGNNCNQKRRLPPVRKEREIKTYLSYLDRAKVIGTRARQLENNFDVLISSDNLSDSDNSITIAYKEFEQNKLGHLLIIKRDLKGKISYTRGNQY